MSIAAEVERLKKLPEEEWRMIIASQIPSSEARQAAEILFARKQSRINFWTKDVVAWLALGLSIISLLLQVRK